MNSGFAPLNGIDADRMQRAIRRNRAGVARLAKFVGYKGPLDNTVNLVRACWQHRLVGFQTLADPAEPGLRGLRWRAK